MGSVMLAILLIMKQLVGADLLFVMELLQQYNDRVKKPMLLLIQGKRKHFRLLRAAGPLTAVVLGTIIAKLWNSSSISLVSVALNELN